MGGWFGDWLGSWAGLWFGGSAGGQALSVPGLRVREERRWTVREEPAPGRVASHREEPA